MTQAEREQENGKEREKDREKEKDKEQQRGVKRPIVPASIPESLQEVRCDAKVSLDHRMHFVVLLKMFYRHQLAQQHVIVRRVSHIYIYV